MSKFQKGTIPWNKGKKCPEISKRMSGRKLSEETRKKISDFQKGKKRESCPEERKKKISNSLKGHIVTEETRNKMRGKIISEETRKKLVESHKGQKGWWTGKHHSEETRLKISKAKKGRPSPMKGKTSTMAKEKHWNWLGGKSFEPYSTDWTRSLRISIRERDHYTCRLCGKKQGDRAFSVHHIDYDKQNNDPNNLITLCINCHIKTNFKRETWVEYFRNLLF